MARRKEEGMKNRMTGVGTHLEVIHQSEIDVMECEEHHLEYLIAALHCQKNTRAPHIHPALSGRHLDSHSFSILRIDIRI